MIDYVDAACKAWGRCSRWVLADTNEGFPHRDTIRKAADGMLSMREQTVFSRRFPEVRLGDALMVARAMKAEPLMPEVLTAHIWTQYVIKGHARHKLPGLSQYLGITISLSEYWRNLDRAHYFLAGRIALRNS